MRDLSNMELLDISAFGAKNNGEISWVVWVWERNCKFVSKYLSLLKQANFY
jgi:hypothetical protein